ncbi:Chlorophyll a-b binding protein [Psidium guajava]|nr:Chlorophyll a-b binding protein [Psidium guajava]
MKLSLKVPATKQPHTVLILMIVPVMAASTYVGGTETKKGGAQTCLLYYKLLVTFLVTFFVTE